MNLKGKENNKYRVHKEDHGFNGPFSGSRFILSGRYPLNGKHISIFLIPFVPFIAAAVVGSVPLGSAAALSIFE